MSLLHRKVLAGFGTTVAAVASTAFLASPAQAASAGYAQVVGSSTVQFNAQKGKANSLTITIKGRTVTLDDKVALKAGKGCKAVKGDKTKVKCTTSKKTKTLNVSLGDKNDTVTNKTGVYLLVNGGSGNDTLNGGSGKDELQGGSGNDKLIGNGGNDRLYGQSGADTAFGKSGNDLIAGGTGNDTLGGDTGNDEIVGESGNDSLYGSSGIDTLVGGTGADKISAGDGDDIVDGEAGVDNISGGNGNDVILGGADNDRIDAGAGDDVVFGQAGNDTIFGRAGIDLLAGEEVDDDLKPTGNAAAVDMIDGGDDLDLCFAAAGRADNCENPAEPPASMSFAPVQQKAVASLSADLAKATK
ncbi:hemolysin type calcium-binding protein [Krasilnikovia cinnamomea]|uniref:Hemolysin type calcium-binding protein n=1 Tax=Krasilnikovia cinnamomea TaxID=349313 RepID=A0A4V2G7F3_9ACTN|nr:calcium-binding protein [Krasilnikovia cinnamomea]RZU52366.1 hemolysin type calcium-binding protein [Krasilnikovia cinnamomea]